MTPRELQVSAITSVGARRSLDDVGPVVGTVQYRCCIAPLLLPIQSLQDDVSWVELRQAVGTMTLVIVVLVGLFLLLVLGSDRFLVWSVGLQVLRDSGQSVAQTTTHR